MIARSCPKCGGAVPGEDTSVDCRYCGASLVAPQAPMMAPPHAPPAKRHALVFAAIAIPAVVLGVLALVVLLRHGPASPPSPPSPPSLVVATSSVVEPPLAAAPVAAASTTRAEVPKTSAFAEVAFEFGEKGKGPGQLDDASQIAVDPSGDVYVASPYARRIQHFDPAGKFVDAIELPEGTQDNLVQGLAATFDGHLWVTRGGDLVKVALATGKVVKTIRSDKPKVSYQAVAVDSTNAVFATNIGAITFISTNGRLPQSDNIRKFDKNGNVLAIWKDVGGSMGASLAVDGDGNLYSAERRSPFIDILDPKGKVKARFNGPHGFGAGIAVDGKRRIFTGGRGINVFDATGSKLGTIGTDEVKFLTLGPKERLYAIIQDGPIRVYALR